MVSAIILCEGIFYVVPERLVPQLLSTEKVIATGERGVCIRWAKLNNRFPRSAKNDVEIASLNARLLFCKHT